MQYIGKFKNKIDEGLKIIKEIDGNIAETDEITSLVETLKNLTSTDDNSNIIEKQRLSFIVWF
jgi:hypothetical protein